MRLDRIEKDEQILVDVIRCGSQPDLDAVCLACRTLDISEEGIGVVSNIDFPVGTQLDLRVSCADTLYRLKGNVRWSCDNGEYHIGLLLSEDSLDYNAWLKRFQLDF